VRVCLGLWVRARATGCAFVGVMGAFVGVRYHAPLWAIVSKINELQRFYHSFYHAWIIYRLCQNIIGHYLKINRRLSLCLFFKYNGPIMLKKVAVGIF
jgi:hypothetical protein